MIKVLDPRSQGKSTATASLKKALAAWLREVQYGYIGVNHKKICGSFIDFNSEGLAIAILQHLKQSKLICQLIERAEET